MSKERILVIEDEEDILALIHFNLVKEGFRVDCATTGEEGFKKAKDVRPSLILLDLMLPRMSGLEVLAALREQEVDTAVIILPAYGSLETAITALRQGSETGMNTGWTPKCRHNRITVPNDLG